MLFTTKYIKELLASSYGRENDLKRVIAAYSGNLPGNDTASLTQGIELLKRDLSYDPDPHVALLNFTPEDRLAHFVHPLWSDRLTARLAELCCDEIVSGEAEELFRWDRAETYGRISAAAKDIDVALPESGSERYSFYSPYAYSRLYIAGIVPFGTGILLRRVNCRPWYVKPIGE